MIESAEAPRLQNHVRGDDFRRSALQSKIRAGAYYQYRPEKADVQERFGRRSNGKEDLTAGFSSLCGDGRWRFILLEYGYFYKENGDSGSRREEKRGPGVEHNPEQ